MGERSGGSPAVPLGCPRDRRDLPSGITHQPHPLHVVHAAHCHRLYRRLRIRAIASPSRRSIQLVRPRVGHHPRPNGNYFGGYWTGLWPGGIRAAHCGEFGSDRHGAQPAGTPTPTVPQLRHPRPDPRQHLHQHAVLSGGSHLWLGRLPL